MVQALARPLALVAALALAGCHVSEYVVARDDAPLYATSDTAIPARKLVLGQHGRVVDASAPNDRFEIQFDGHTGYVRRSDVEVVEYLTPVLDHGKDRDEKVPETVRRVVVAQEGTGWPAPIRKAALEGRILFGMTHGQVEAAWGPPTSAEVTRRDGASDRWTYRRRSYELVVTSGPLWMLQVHARSWRDPWTADSTFRCVRIPIVEEKVVDFEGGEVSRYWVRFYPDGKEPEVGPPTTRPVPAAEPER